MFCFCSFCSFSSTHLRALACALDAHRVGPIPLWQTDTRPTQRASRAQARSRRWEEEKEKSYTPTYFFLSRFFSHSAPMTLFFPTLSILGLFSKTCFWADLAFGHVAAREQPPGVCVGDARKNGRTVASAARASHRALRPLHRVDHQNSSADQHRRPGVRDWEPI